jgi:hypothetical protein
LALELGFEEDLFDEDAAADNEPQSGDMPFSTSTGSLPSSESSPALKVFQSMDVFEESRPPGEDKPMKVTPPPRAPVSAVRKNNQLGEADAQLTNSPAATPTRSADAHSSQFETPGKSEPFSPPVVLLSRTGTDTKSQPNLNALKSPIFASSNSPSGPRRRQTITTLAPMLQSSVSRSGSIKDSSTPGVSRRRSVRQKSESISVVITGSSAVTLGGADGSAKSVHLDAESIRKLSITHASSITPPDHRFESDSKASESTPKKMYRRYSTIGSNSYPFSNSSPTSTVSSVSQISDMSPLSPIRSPPNFAAAVEAKERNTVRVAIRALSSGPDSDDDTSVGTPVKPVARSDLVPSVLPPAAPATVPIDAPQKRSEPQIEASEVPVGVPSSSDTNAAKGGVISKFLKTLFSFGGNKKTAVTSDENRGSEISGSVDFAYDNPLSRKKSFVQAHAYDAINERHPEKLIEIIQVLISRRFRVYWC